LPELGLGGHITDVWGGNYPRFTPEGMFWRQRFALKYVEARTGNLALADCRERVVLVDDWTTRRVDDVGALGFINPNLADLIRPLVLSLSRRWIEMKSDSPRQARRTLSVTE
jgi:hypothetical protein